MGEGCGGHDFLWRPVSALGQEERWSFYSGRKRESGKESEKALEQVVCARGRIDEGRRLLALSHGLDPFTGVIKYLSKEEVVI